MTENNINPKNKSPWFFIVLIFIGISFGSFWFIELSKIAPAPLLIATPPKDRFMDTLKSLEMTASAIEIMDYSEEL